MKDIPGYEIFNKIEPLILDRRTGKRTLEKLKPTVDEQPEWLRYFYQLRLESEGL